MLFISPEKFRDFRETGPRPGYLFILKADCMTKTCCVYMCLGGILHGDNKTSNNSKIYMPNGTRLLMATEKNSEGNRRKNSFVGRFTEERSRPSENIPCISTQQNSGRGMQQGDTYWG